MTRDELITRYKAGERNFRGADLAGVNLRWVNLAGVDLRNADLAGVDLRNADLAGVDLRNACLRGADLTDANSRGADLRGTCQTRANLRRANLAGVVVDWPVGWSPGTIVRCQACQCGKTEAGYTDAKVILASQVGGMVYILHEGNEWPLAVSLSEAEEMREECGR